MSQGTALKTESSSSSLHLQRNGNSCPVLLSLPYTAHPVPLPEKNQQIFFWMFIVFFFVVDVVALDISTRVC